MYQELRSEARDHARARNAFFQQATQGLSRPDIGALAAQLIAYQVSEMFSTLHTFDMVAAYLGGNKALAKELSAKGRWHNDQMKEAHQSACKDTY